VGAADPIEARPEAFRAVAWRTGTKGPLQAELAALRVRVADGSVAARAQHLPGEARQRRCRGLVGEHRANGERKCHLSNLPADTPRETLVSLIKARWACEQTHRQLKDAGRRRRPGASTLSKAGAGAACITTPFSASSPSPSSSTCGSGGKSADTPPEPGPPPRPSLPAIRRRILAALTRVLLRCPHCRRRFEHHLRL
jgi:hypothetical protein